MIASERISAARASDAARHVFFSGIGHPLVAKETDRLIRLSMGVLSTPPSPAVRNHRIGIRLALRR